MRFRIKHILLASTVSFGLSAQIATADIKAAQTALTNRDYQTAMALAKASSVENPYDAALIMARSLIEIGQPVEAQKFAEFAIDRVPNSFAGRILLATALRHQKKNLASELQFRRALDVADTDAERNIARKSMRAVEGSKKWSGSLSFGIAPTTNVAKVSTANRIGTVFDDFLQNFTRNEKPEDATGIFYGATIARNFRGPAGASMTFSVGQKRREYEASENNSKTTTLRFASTAPMTQKGQSYFSLDRVISDYADELYTQKTGVTFGHAFKSFGARRANVSIGLDQTRYVRNDLDAQKFRFGVTHDVFANRNVSLSFSYAYARSMSDSIDYQSKRNDITANFAFHPPSTGWQVNLSLNRGWEDWDKKKPLFVNKRHDIDMTTTISVQNKNLSFLGLTPVISATYQNRNSSVNLYDVDSRDYFVGITNAF